MLELNSEKPEMSCREATALPLAEKEILACHWLDFFFNAGLHSENTDGVV